MNGPDLLYSHARRTRLQLGASCERPSSLPSPCTCSPPLMARRPLLHWDRRALPEAVAAVRLMSPSDDRRNATHHGRHGAVRFVPRLLCFGSERCAQRPLDRPVVRARVRSYAPALGSALVDRLGCPYNRATDHQEVTASGPGALSCCGSIRWVRFTWSDKVRASAALPFSPDDSRSSRCWRRPVRAAHPVTACSRSSRRTPRRSARGRGSTRRSTPFDARSVATTPSSARVISCSVLGLHAELERVGVADSRWRADWHGRRGARHARYADGRRARCLTGREMARVRRGRRR